MKLHNSKNLAILKIPRNNHKIKVKTHKNNFLINIQINHKIKLFNNRNLVVVSFLIIRTQKLQKFKFKNGYIQKISMKLK